MSIILKRATISDIPALITLEKSVAGSKTYSAMLTEKEWAGALGTDTVYLIEKDGQIVGNVSYQKKHESHAEITGLVITPEFQGRGIGHEALIQVLEELKDVKRIDLVTHPDNTAALKLYQSLGFGVESKKENYFGDGQPRLVLSLQKP